MTHRAHFEVMYRPELYHRDDGELGRARADAATLLYGTGELTGERMAYGVAAWSIVHGLATLWLNGNLPAQLGDDPEEITRVVAAHLSPPRRDPALACRATFRRVGGRVWLLPENPAYDPLPGNRAKIVGKVVYISRTIR